jgi:16S rRNA (guanine1207-N2)-methyltransferase
MSLLHDLPISLPPAWETLYRAAWPSADLLAEVVPFAAARGIVVLGGAADPLTLFAAQRAPSADCLVADDDAAAGGTLGELAGQAGLAHLHPADPAGLLPEGRGNLPPFDLALANTLYHPNKHVSLCLLALGHALLAPGGRLYAAGANNRGIRSIQEEIERLFGNATVMAMRKGHRVISAVRGGGTVAPQGTDGHAEPAIEMVTVRGQIIGLGLSPAVFAGGRLDPAAALLAATLEVRSSDVVVDLGCGSGIVGLVAARLAPQGHVYLLDSSYAAVRLAAANARRNSVANVTALAGDILAPVKERGVRPDVIVTNPPFHAGQVQVQLPALRFIAESAERLAPDGRLYLVANRFLPYETELRRHFSELREVAGDTRFKVVLAVGPLRAA